ncbi:hypothetical protein [Persicitalea sp.]|uniref:hypothetical protein n=1 Tax=Persicitalea sp. TaxID=3100273 RepID=UPI0035944393
MDFKNFAILYLLIIVQVGGYFWLQNATRKESRYISVYQYISDSYMVVSLLAMSAFELIVMAFDSP